MTVKELIKKLEQFPQNYEVAVPVVDYLNEGLYGIGQIYETDGGIAEKVIVIDQDDDNLVY